jgi:hypothetical protein
VVEITDQNLQDPMKFWRIPLVITAALILGRAPQDANAQLLAGRYNCASVTVNGSGQITAITANECPSRTIWLHGGGNILIHSGGKLACHSC